MTDEGKLKNSHGQTFSFNFLACVIMMLGAHFRTPLRLFWPFVVVGPLLFFVVLRNLQKYEKCHNNVRIARAITLETQKCQSKGPHIVELQSTLYNELPETGRVFTELKMVGTSTNCCFRFVTFCPA